MAHSDKLRLFNQAVRLVVRLIDKSSIADEGAFNASMRGDGSEFGRQVELRDRYTYVGLRATERATRRELDVAGDVELN